MNSYNYYSPNTNTYYLKNDSVHGFLKALNQYPQQSTTEKQIDAVAQKHFSLNFPLSVFFSGERASNVEQAIVKSVNTLMHDVVKMSSFSEAQQEIAGAINGLNILLRQELTESEQKKLKEDIQTVSQCEQKIRDIFLVKEALASRPEWKAVLNDPDFLRDFETLSTLYGRARGRTMNPYQALLFTQVWLDKNHRTLLREFITLAQQAREANLQILSQKQIPLLEDEHNVALNNKHTDLTEVIVGAFDDQTAYDFKALIDDIATCRILIRNTQEHLDGLDLVFNGGHIKEATVAQRLRAAVQKNRENIKSNIQQLQEKLQEPTLSNADRQRIQEEINNWQKLDGYKQLGSIFTLATWDPMIRLEDPIQPVNRTIGFATKEGRNKITTTSLDFTTALGEENLNLTEGERKLLDQLLSACDFLIREPAQYKEWEDSRIIPPRVLEALSQFDQPQFPHLSTLSPQQKEDLVSEAFRFSFDVNYHYADDLLNLMP